MTRLDARAGRDPSVVRVQKGGQVVVGYRKFRECASCSNDFHTRFRLGYFFGSGPSTGSGALRSLGLSKCYAFNVVKRRLALIKNAAKVRYRVLPCGKCVQNGAFVAKFGDLWRNSGVFGVKMSVFGELDGEFRCF